MFKCAPPPPGTFISNKSRGGGCELEYKANLISSNNTFLHRKEGAF